MMKIPEHIYFLGIGGIGMSAIARYMNLLGKQVAGYDRVESVVTEALVSEGVEVFYQPDADHVASADWMVYTPAIGTEHVEFQAAKSRGIPIMKRSQVLGKISEGYQTLAVAGTHGKTTTSTMLAHVLKQIGADPTAFLGGISSNLQSNFTFGKSDWMVVEADEFDRSFMTLHPSWSVLTSVDPDHLDIYGSHEEMLANFKAYVGQCDQVMLHESLAEINWGKPSKTYGIERGDYRAENLVFEALTTRFDFVYPAGKLEGLTLHMPGHHNVSNMTAALAIAVEIGMEPSLFASAVESFSGIYRRFEVQVDGPDVCYIDDYAHHPTELEAALRTARSMFPERKLVVVFQPHLYSRTQDFHEGFSAALSEADEVLLMDIYPAREEPIPGVTSQLILDGIKHAKAQLVSKTELIDALDSRLDGPAVVMTLGAGNIDREVARIGDFLKDRKSS
ncbi:UDP-N-acetylmuramate--L-alanine ligase [Pontibacter sp. G13]|uniref:UDP-N-acetylmuramate--L-alanine ligase n=1 Tax=Pontibacter sp. G13 TaxID=3074898 RepID=UPI002889032F|nr:UDP-N-acetylmuramate--L-alanine ligase [Pontibacter sp. G13]WNJ20253.1 UDP-N-acetylmuramate--L-alanine ligase [Pontibacter sp. G13]